MKTRTEDLAYENGLELVEITQGMNGYPSGLYKAVSGFESFEDAECFADEVNGEVVLLSRRDGHQFWVNHGRQYEPLERAKFIDENNEEMFTSESSFESWANDVVKNALEEGESIYDLKGLLYNLCEACDLIYEMDATEIAIVNKNDYDCYVYPKHDTHIHDDDVTDYMLAVVDHETDEGEDEEEDED